MKTACSGGHGATQTAAPFGKVTPEETVAEAARRPGVLAAMQRLGLDHCCGASLTIAEAAASAGILLPELLAGLDKASLP